MTKRARSNEQSDSDIDQPTLFTEAQMGLTQDQVLQAQMIGGNVVQNSQVAPETTAPRHPDDIPRSERTIQRETRGPSQPYAAD